MMRHLLYTVSLIAVVLLAGCTTTGGKTPEQQRQSVLAMKNEVLTDLYQLKPDVKAQLASAPGYAVFSNANINIIFASFGGGYGVVKNNQTGAHTYMKMGEAGVGFGLGVKDFRAVFVFHDVNTMNNFVDKGWDFGVQGDAAAKAGEQGGAVGADGSIANVTIYQLTQSGLVLQATIRGTKYWKDSHLN